MNYTLRTTAYFEMVVVPALKARNLKNGQKSYISHSFPS